MVFPDILMGKPDTLMHPWPRHRQSISARLLAGYAAELGVPSGICLRGTGLTSAILANPEAEIDAEQELRVVTNLIRARGGYVPALGLEAGQRYHLTAYGVWGFAIISSPTLRAAIDLGLRYLDLTFAFVRVRFEENGAEARLIMEERAIPPACRQFLLERDMAALVTLMRDVFNFAPPLGAVRFRHAAPADPSPYEQTFGVAPRFGQTENSVSFPAAFLDTAIPQTDTPLASDCESQCRELLARRQARSGISGRVRDLLLQQPHNMPDMEAVATALCMSSRTLRRQLTHENVSFRQLVDEVRIALAEELLDIPGMTMEAISGRLGYSEVSNFLHAFKRCTGQTPTAFRRQRA